MNRSQIVNQIEAICVVNNWLRIDPQPLIKVDRPPPPLAIAFNILPTLEVLNAAAVDLGMDDYKINSAYRDPQYNDWIGGEKDSQHTHFRALDVDPGDGCTVEQLYEYLNKHTWGKYLALGIYNTFVHIDCRHWPGLPGHGLRPARWDQRTKPSA
jgi:hypothetical protein